MIGSESAVQVGIVVATVVGLWIGARLLVDSVVRLARRIGLSELTIGLTVVAAGTSAPELVVTSDAALKGLGDIAVGNIVGSNIYNLAFVLGVVSMLRVVPIERSLVRRDGVALLASSVVGAYAVFDLTVTRLEGVVLLGLFAAYTGFLLRSGAGAEFENENESEDGTDPDPDPDSAAVDAHAEEETHFRARDVAALVGGLAVVLVSGDLMVGAASSLARGAGISEWVIGGTIVAAGTSTPEFAVSLVAIRSGRLGVSIGNIVGSNIFNFLGIMGLAAAIRPLALSGGVRSSVAWLLVVSAGLVAALWTGRRLSRSEGGLFVTSEVVRWVVGLLGGGQ
ncbi:calcium/sodium antiporter [Halogeometricum sp. S1BR25-6]|uniref:Calcium/sodium antiporter n=1 Tax=Halogeometricum salsisoli TaxID=2950536 RepID=A0ABU2GI63_9EURY|nr:calcium/sodium antiporter [Halogeometricum sp. S1BR25-6]MDS0300472.1 calcium/sodium antiporter [Halogeometricum sp. S1BR25-6]